MKRVASFLACVLVACVVLGGNNAIAQKAKEATVWPSANIKWSEMKGGPPGIMYSNLWGNVEKGNYGALIKLPAGIKNPPHSHTSDTRLVVLSGTFVYAPIGGETQRLGPGSYLFVPGGVKHTSGTSDEGPCEVFQEGPGKFDFVPAEQQAGH